MSRDERVAIRGMLDLLIVVLRGLSAVTGT